MNQLIRIEEYLYTQQRKAWQVVCDSSGTKNAALINKYWALNDAYRTVWRLRRNFYSL